MIVEVLVSVCESVADYFALLSGLTRGYWEVVGLQVKGYLKKGSYSSLSVCPEKRMV
jgi:hypothetical protein